MVLEQRERWTAQSWNRNLRLAWRSSRNSKDVFLKPLSDKKVFLWLSSLFQGLSSFTPHLASLSSSAHAAADRLVQWGRTFRSSCWKDGYGTFLHVLEPVIPYRACVLEWFKLLPQQTVRVLSANQHPTTELKRQRAPSLCLICVYDTGSKMAAKTGAISNKHVRKHDVFEMM